MSTVGNSASYRIALLRGGSTLNVGHFYESEYHEYLVSFSEKDEQFVVTPNNTLAAVHERKTLLLSNGDKVPHPDRFSLTANIEQSILKGSGAWSVHTSVNK